MPRISERLHAVLQFYANQREYFFCDTRFRYVIIFAQTIFLKKFTLFGGIFHFGVNHRWQSVAPKLEFCKSSELRSR